MREQTKAEPIILAKFGRTHGINGWQYIESYCEKKITEYKSLLLLSSKKEENAEDSKNTNKINILQNNLQLEGLKQQGRRWITRVQGVGTLEEASSLTNSFLGVMREELPEPAKDSYYWRDLMGARVISLYMGQEIMLGTIVNMQRLPANDNMVVRNESGKNYYIPFVRPDYVTEVQVQETSVPPVIKVNWDPDF